MDINLFVWIALMFMRKGLSESANLLGQLVVYTAAMGTLIGMEIGTVTNITPYWVSNLQLNSIFNVAKNGNFESWLQREQRFISNSRFDIRIRVAHNEAWGHALEASVCW